MMAVGAHAEPGGAALSFDGTDDYAVTESAVNVGNTFTIEFWAKPDVLKNFGDLLSADLVTDKTLTFVTYESGVIAFGLGSGNAWGNLVSAPAGTLQTGVWHHVAGVANGGTIELYVNGVSMGTAANNNALNDRIVIGARVPTTYYFGGSIDDVRIWDDVRTGDEIRANMHRELTGAESDLVAYYPMSDASGTTFSDHCFGGNHGTLHNGATWKASGAFMGPRNCLDFKGHSSYDHVSIADTASLRPASNLTIECWMLYNGESASYQPLIWKNGSNATDAFCAYGLRRLRSGVESWAGKFGFDVITTTGGRVWIASTTAPEPLRWYHVAATYDGTEIALYVDGVLEADAAQTGPMIDTSGRPLWLSRAYWSNHYHDGKLDEVRIWNCVRTANQIRESMCRTLMGNEAGLVAYYRFDQSDGAALYDVTGNGHNGTLVNMTDADWVASSAFNTWIGADNAAWSTAANWSRNAVPGSSDNVGLHAWTPGNAVTVTGSPTVGILVVSTNASAALSSDITVNGALLLESDVDLNGQTVTLGASAMLVEDQGFFHGGSGAITTTRSLSNIDEDVAGLGAAITTSANLGNTTVTRRHAAQDVNGAPGVNRYYDIVPANNSGLDATLVFHYRESELNGIDESALSFFRSADGGTSWTEYVGSGNSDADTLTRNGIDAFSRWTAGTAVLPRGTLFKFQ